MRKISYLILFFMPLICSSQSNGEIFGFSLTHRYDFNYIDGSYDSITLPSSFLYSAKSTYDPYRRIMYYVGNQSVYAYDLAHNSITNLHATGLSIKDIKYDMFRHALLIRSQTSMYFYYLETDSLDLSCDLPNYGSGSYSSIPMAYDPYTNEYAFMNTLAPYFQSDSVYYINVNVLTGEILDTVHPLQYAPQGWPHLGHFWQYSYPDHEIYVMHKEEAVNSSPRYLSILDLNDGSFEDVLSLPSDYDSHLYSQLATFDQLNNLYLLPYYTGSSQNKLIVADVNNKTLYTLPFLKQTSMHHADYYPSPILFLKNDTLKANYFTNYTWYIDSVEIAGETEQNHIPQMNGLYYYTTTDTIGNIHYSNEVFINWLGINELQQEVSLFPNPTDGIININLINESLNLENYSYQIHNLVGKQLKEGGFKRGAIQSVEISDFTPGMYIISVKKDNQVIYSTKLIKK